MEQAFYTVAIIYMSLQILMYIAIIILLYFLYKKITEVAQGVAKRIEVIEDTISHPRDFAAQVGATVMEGITERVKGFITGRRHHSHKE